MPELPVFSFEELSGAVKYILHQMIASDRGMIEEKAREEGLTREQAVASFVAAAMKGYAETHAPRMADGSPLNASPDWRYVTARCSDLLTQMYVDDQKGARQMAAQHAMGLEEFAASIVTTDLRDYLKDGKRHEIQIEIPEAFLDEELGR